MTKRGKRKNTDAEDSLSETSGEDQATTSSAGQLQAQKSQQGQAAQQGKQASDIGAAQLPRLIEAAAQQAGATVATTTVPASATASAAAAAAATTAVTPGGAIAAQPTVAPPATTARRGPNGTGSTEPAEPPKKSRRSVNVEETAKMLKLDLSKAKESEVVMKLLEELTNANQTIGELRAKVDQLNAIQHQHQLQLQHLHNQNPAAFQGMAQAIRKMINCKNPKEVDTLAITLASEFNSVSDICSYFNPRQGHPACTFTKMFFHARGYDLTDEDAHAVVARACKREKDRRYGKKIPLSPEQMAATENCTDIANDPNIQAVLANNFNTIPPTLYMLAYALSRVRGKNKCEEVGNAMTDLINNFRSGKWKKPAHIELPSESNPINMSICENRALQALEARLKLSIVQNSVARPAEAEPEEAES